MLHRWLLLHGGRWDSIPSREGLGWAWSKSAKRSGGPYLIDFTVQLDGFKLRPFLKVKKSYERNLNRVLTKCIILLGL